MISNSFPFCLLPGDKKMKFLNSATSCMPDCTSVQSDYEYKMCCDRHFTFTLFMTLFDLVHPQGTEEVMPAKTILTTTAFLTFWTCALRTTASAALTSGSFKWFIWTLKEQPKLTPTGWSDTRAKSWFRLPILTLVSLWVSMRSFRTAHLVFILTSPSLIALQCF